MTPQQRFIGPELSDLLQEVRSELGDQAIIHEANRIRHGGVGGFFRKEGFEVLASPPPSAAGSAGPRPQPSVADEQRRSRRLLGRGSKKSTTSEAQPIGDLLDVDEALIDKLTNAMESERAWADAIGNSTAAGTSTSDVISPSATRAEPRPVRRFGPDDLAPIPESTDRIAPASALLERVAAPDEPLLGRTPTPGQALLDRADSISNNERVGQLVSGARDVLGDRTVSSRSGLRPSTAPARTTLARTTSVPPRGLMDEVETVERFSGLLHRAIDTPKPIGSDTNQRARTRSLPAELATTVPTPKPTHRAAASAKPQATAGNGVGFWDDLAQLEQVLPLRPTAHANVQLVVGPLDVALPLANRFASDTSIELAVLSDEIELLGVLDEQMTESSRDLHQRLLTRARDGARAIGVIEADDDLRERGSSLDRMLPPRLLTMIDRVCADGAVDLLRLTLRSMAPVEEMKTLIESFSVPCAIDLATAPTGAELDAALDAGLPIVSIAGRQLTPALAMALKHR